MGVRGGRKGANGHVTAVVVAECAGHVGQMGIVECGGFNERSHGWRTVLRERREIRGAAQFVDFGGREREEGRSGGGPVGLSPISAYSG